VSETSLRAWGMGCGLWSQPIRRETGKREALTDKTLRVRR
jgi:hypothetical protein